jgi:hypothetical protein
MPRILDDRHVRPAVATLLGCSDVGPGPTDEQLALIDALATAYFGLDAGAAGIDPMEPSAAAASFSTAAERRRMRELLVTVELCRHPLGADQVARTDAYIQALGADDASSDIIRDLVRDGVAAAAADFLRSFGEHEPELREPSLAGARGSAPVTTDPDLAARLARLHACPAGSLGRAYVEFYDRHGFAIPGSDDQPAAVFVAHDMCHVIAGYEPDGVGEIALGAMQLALTDSDVHWIQFLGNLGVHEAGYLTQGAAHASLGRPGAAEAVAHALDRGSRCTGDFTVVDHLAMVDEPLADVRRRYGVPPRER